MASKLGEQTAVDSSAEETAWPSSSDLEILMATQFTHLLEEGDFPKGRVSCIASTVPDMKTGSFSVVKALEYARRQLRKAGFFIIIVNWTGAYDIEHHRSQLESAFEVPIVGVVRGVPSDGDICFKYTRSSGDCGRPWGRLHYEGCKPSRTTTGIDLCCIENTILGNSRPSWLEIWFLVRNADDIQLLFDRFGQGG
jgi:hypothetical protein